MIKLRSWSQWNEDGLIDVLVDEDVLNGYVKDLEMQIADAVMNKNYSLASDLISEREKVVGKLIKKELKDGKSID